MMRAIVPIFCALALIAPVQAAVRPRPADGAVAVANPEETANGVGWKRFVHTFSGDGMRADAHATVVTAAPALASWALTVGCLACAATLMRRRGWFRN